MHPGVNGFLVDADVESLASGLRQMLGHRAETRAMGERAAQSIQKQTWAAVTDEFIQVFLQVLNHKGAKAQSNK